MQADSFLEQGENLHKGVYVVRIKTTEGIQIKWIVKE